MDYKHKYLFMTQQFLDEDDKLSLYGILYYQKNIIM